MTQMKTTMEVAKWEFFRFFKIKDLVWTILFFLVISGGSLLIQHLFLKAGEKEVKLAVKNPTGIQFQLPSESRIQLTKTEGKSIETLKTEVRDKKIDGLLIINSIDEAQLFVLKKPGWKENIEKVLNNTRMEAKLKIVKLSQEELINILTPFKLDIEYFTKSETRSTTTEMVFAGLLIVLMIMGVFIGNSYLFIGITGEKQLQITEQVISAVSPQVWIDGKILGISLVSIIKILWIGISIFISYSLKIFFRPSFHIPFELIHPMVLFQFIVLVILGFFFWLSFFAAIASTINDPNTSAKSGFMLFPVLPLIFAFLVLKDPDTVLLKILGILPLTSSTVLPARIALSEVAIWEFLVAVLLLCLSVWMMRKAAGKIFQVGMLMYGKEPKLSEMIKWVRKSKTISNMME